MTSRANPARMSEPTPSNPIVALAMKLRARKDIDGAIDSATPAARATGDDGTAADAAASLAAFGAALQIGTKRLNSILGRSGVTFVRLEKPLRLRLRFADRRIGLDLDEARQLISIKGDGLDGEYQFDGSETGIGLINLSILSTEPGYGELLTPNGLLKRIAAEAELPRPAHLDGAGPLSF